MLFSRRGGSFETIKNWRLNSDVIDGLSFQEMPAERRSTRNTSNSTVAVEPTETPVVKSPKSPATKAASKQLKVGDQLGGDDIKVSTDTGSEITLSSLWSTTGAIIFFYPRANTPGCTTQACGFRDNHPVISATGYQVYGMSADPVKSQANWKAKKELPYTLLSDLSKDRRALKTLGVHKGGAGSGITRSHLVIAKGGQVEAVHYQVSPKDSFTEVTAFVTSQK